MGQFLTIAPGVILTPIITPVIEGLDKYCAAAGFHATVTSGLRDAEKQLNVIREYLTTKGLLLKYSDYYKWKATDIVNGQYVWQMAWSDLLHNGVIINPPIAAVCLMDSLRADGTNRRGSIIHETPHSHGTAFNIGGIAILPIVQKALAEKMPGLLDFLVERENNAIHIDCHSINSLR